MSGLCAVFSLALRAQCRRTLTRALWLLAPLLGVAAAMSAEGTDLEGVRGVAEAGQLLLPALMLAAAALGSAALRGERGEESLRALLLAPLPRWKILTGTLLAAQLCALVLTVLAAGTALAFMLISRGFGDIGPADMTPITTADVINAQAWLLAPLALVHVPVAVLAGMLGSVLVAEQLMAFLMAVVLLTLPLSLESREHVPFTPVALADHVLLTLGDLGRGTTENEALVESAGYRMHHFSISAAWSCAFLAAALIAFRRPRSA